MGTTQPGEIYLASFTPDHQASAPCLGKTVLPMPSSLPTATSELASSRLRVHCFMPHGNTTQGPKTRPKHSQWLLQVPEAHGTSSALAYHQAMGQVTDVSLPYRFFLERENRPDHNPYITAYAEPRQMLRTAFSHWIFDCMQTPNAIKDSHGQYEFPSNPGNTSISELLSCSH